MNQDEESEYLAFVANRGDVLRRLAYLLGGDWHLAEDATQTALAKPERRRGPVLQPILACPH